MEAIVSPLRRLGEDTAWFVRDDALEVLRVRCPARSRRDVLRTIATYEHHGDNRAPFVVLEDAHSPDDPGWTTRALRLLEIAGAEPSAIGSLRGAVAFVAAARHVDTSWEPPRRGTVIILAPAILQAVETYVEALHRLLEAVSGSGIRFVLVDDTAEVDALAQARGHAWVGSVVRIDDAALHRQLADSLARSRAAPQGAPAPMATGAAWPRGVIPPRRIDEPTTDAAAVRAVTREDPDLAPPMTVAQGLALRNAVLGAALASRNGDPKAAVEQQRTAEAVCADAGLDAARIMMKMVQAAYLLQAEQPSLARRTYRDASQLAERAELWSLASRAQLALGMLDAVDEDRVQAIVAYRQAARFADLGYDSLLAIEAWRMLGVHAMELGRPEEATTAWLRATTLGENPELGASGSAAEAARALADLCRSRGLRDQADDLQQRALVLEGSATGDDA